MSDGKPVTAWRHDSINVGSGSVSSQFVNHFSVLVATTGPDTEGDKLALEKRPVLFCSCEVRSFVT
jgi:hypothetical protein